MFEKIANIFKIPDLRKRVLFTLGMLAVYRLGSHIPTPGINADMLAQFFNQNSGSALGLVDLFSGGNLRKLTVFALGIMPYITASIIFQLLTVIYEPLAKLQKEGELGRRKITQWTRYVTVLLGIVQSFAIALTLTNTSTGQSWSPSRAAPSFLSASSPSPPARPSSCGWVNRSPSAASATVCRLLIFTGIVVGLPAGIRKPLREGPRQRLGSLHSHRHPHPDRGMIAVVAFIVYRRALRAPHPRPVRQAHRRPQDDGRPIHPPSAQGQLRRRDAGHLRELHPVGASALRQRSHLRLLAAGLGFLRPDLPRPRSR